MKELDHYATARERGVYELWQMQVARTELCKAYLERWRAVPGLDAILCPTTPYASTLHGTFRYVGYTGIFNILDYAAASFPCGVKADQKLDKLDESLEPLSGLCSSVRSSYNAQAVHGHPVSLQLAGRRFEEEKVLHMLDVLLADLRR